MSAPNLRVATTADLVAELERREQALRNGECDACVVRAGLAPNANDEPEHRICRHGARPVDDLCEVCDAE